VLGGCVLFDRAKLIGSGGFDFWPSLPAEHVGKDVAAQLRVLARHGGAGIIPSGVIHLKAPTTMPVRGGRPRRSSLPPSSTREPEPYLLPRAGWVPPIWPCGRPLWVWRHSVMSPSTKGTPTWLPALVPSLIVWVSPDASSAKADARVATGATSAPADPPRMSDASSSVRPMPNKYDELEGRVTAVEHELRRVREDATAARVLAREADRDVSAFGVKLDAHNKTLNALRETQLEMQSRLTLLERKVDDGFARIDQEFALVNQGFTKVEEQFTKLGAGMAHITALLERIIGSE
jgi:hypothetical protein